MITTETTIETVEEQTEATTEIIESTHETQVAEGSTISKDQTFFSQEMVDLMGKIFDSEMACRHAELRVVGCQEELKFAKDSMAERTAALRSLIREAIQLKEGNRNDAKRPLLSPPGEAATATVEKQPNENWRTIPTDVLLDPPIEGFGAKKRTALLEAVPTLGDFEALRGRVGIDAATLRELLPKGIGEQAADALEERLITAIRDHRITDEPAEQPPVAEAVADTEEEEAKPRPSTEEALQNQAVELYEIGKADRAEFDLLGDAHDSNEVAEGVEAYDDDQQVEECPYTFGSDQQKAWVYGWVSKYLDDPNQAIEVLDGDENEEAEIEVEVEEKAAPLEDKPKPSVKSAVLTAQQILDDL